MSLGAALELLVTHKYSVELFPHDRVVVAKRTSWVPEFFRIEIADNNDLFVDGEEVQRACHSYYHHPSLPRRGAL